MCGHSFSRPSKHTQQRQCIHICWHSFSRSSKHTQQRQCLKDRQLRAGKSGFKWGILDDNLVAKILLIRSWSAIMYIITAVAMLLMQVVRFNELRNIYFRFHMYIDFNCECKLLLLFGSFYPSCLLWSFMISTLYYCMRDMYAPTVVSFCLLTRNLALSIPRSSRNWQS